MNIHSFDSLVKSLPTDRAQLEALSAVSRISYHTLLKIAKGETKNPRIRTVEALSDAMRRLRVRS